MKRIQFLASLLVVSLGALSCLWMLDRFLPQSDALSLFAFLSLGIFIALVGFAYFVGVRAARSKSNMRFIQFTMGMVVLKMFVCVAMIVIYVQEFAPESKLFVLPFLLLYLIFTIFEVYILLKVAKMKPAATRVTSDQSTQS